MALRLRLAVDELVDDFGQLVAEEDGHDGRRGLAATQTPGVVQRTDGTHQQEIVAAYRLGDSRIERQELQVLGRRLAWREQVDARIGLHGPVAVLTASVDPVEGLFVEDDLQVVLLGNLVHDDHQQHVLVDGAGRLTEDRRTLELIGSHFVMPSGKLDAQLVSLGLEIFHERRHARRDGAEIVVGQLLVLGRIVADDRPFAELQVRPGVEQRLVHQEVFLLQTDVHADTPHVAVEKLGYICSSIVQGLQRTQQRYLHIQGLARIGDENRRDQERPIQDEYR